MKSATMITKATTDRGTSDEERNPLLLVLAYSWDPFGLDPDEIQRPLVSVYSFFCSWFEENKRALHYVYTFDPDDITAGVYNNSDGTIELCGHEIEREEAAQVVEWLQRSLQTLEQ